MRTHLPIFVLLFPAVTTSAHFADAVPQTAGQAPPKAAMAGEYDLIGRKPDSTMTYSGRVTLSAEGSNLAVSRTINGKIQKGMAKFDTVAGTDRIPVLRMEFVIDGVEHHATYRWQTDPDNYFRFTGMVYLPDHRTKAPGLEALFPISK